MNYKTLIAFLGKNQMKEWANNKSSLIETVGYENYTDETIEELQEMYNNGTIESRPIKTTGGYYGDSVRWEDKDNYLHRPDNLPAYESDPSGREKGELKYEIHNRSHRTDGPARIEPSDRKITWYIDDTRIAIAKVVPSRKIMEIYLGSSYVWLRDVAGWKQYRDEIKAKFPAAGDKIWPWQYMSVKPLAQKTIAEWERQLSV
jgi:hypothetical protein